MTHTEEFIPKKGDATTGHNMTGVEDTMLYEMSQTWEEKYSMISLMSGIFSKSKAQKLRII